MSVQKNIEFIQFRKHNFEDSLFSIIIRCDNKREEHIFSMGEKIIQEELSKLVVKFPSCKIESINLKFYTK